MSNIDLINVIDFTQANSFQRRTDALQLKQRNESVCGSWLIDSRCDPVCPSYSVAGCKHHDSVKAHARYSGGERRSERDKFEQYERWLADIAS